MKERSDKYKKQEKPVTGLWLRAGGACGYYYCEGCECQRATSKGLAAYRGADVGGKGGLREVSHAKSSSCQLSLQLHGSSVVSLANLCLWIPARHTILQPEAYRGRCPPVAALTFTPLPLEVINSHMGPKSSWRLFISCGWSGFPAEGGRMILHGKSKIGWTYDSGTDAR